VVSAARSSPAWALACAAACLGACDPLREVEAPGAVARCAKPCPSGCPDGCLPTGYCAARSLTAEALGLAPLAKGGTWPVSVGGFPPGATVSYALFWGLDIAERAGKEPFDPFIGITVSAAVAFSIRDHVPKFPAWREFDSSTKADGDGVVQLPLVLEDCEGAAPSTCSVAPTSTLDFELVDRSPWLEAPPCD
jgi:hypothetical protein